VGFPRLLVRVSLTQEERKANQIGCQMPYVRNTPVPDKEIEAKPEFECFREVPLWILFDDNGAVMMAGENRSQIFFYATENEMTIHRVQ